VAGNGFEDRRLARTRGANQQTVSRFRDLERDIPQAVSRFRDLERDIPQGKLTERDIDSFEPNHRGIEG